MSKILKWKRERSGSYNERPLYAYEAEHDVGYVITHSISTTVATERGNNCGRAYRRTYQTWFYRGETYWTLRGAKAAAETAATEEAKEA